MGKLKIALALFVIKQEITSHIWAYKVDDLIVKSKAFALIT